MSAAPVAAPGTTDAAVLLDALGAPAAIEVVEERRELLRFGASRITYQHSEERTRVRATLVRGGRLVWGTVESAEPATLRALRERLEAQAALLPPPADDDVGSLAGPMGQRRPAQTFFSSTADATAADRVATLKEMTAALPAGASLGGSIVHATAQHTVASTDGLHHAEGRTYAAIQAGASLAGASSYARQVHRDAASLDVSQLVTDVQAGLAPLAARSAEAGTYRVVLGPQAALTLLATLGQVAFSARAVARGESCLSGRLGERLVSPLLTLVDDGADGAGLPSTFDCTGAPKQHVRLIEAGTAAGVVHDTPTALEAGTVSTGHAVPPAWRFGAGPAASHLVLESGASALSDEDLIGACGNGIFIQRVDYVRVAHAKDTLVTGSTRDATLLIEHGKVVGRLPQLRFTLRLLDVFNNVEAVGARQTRGDAVFMESIAAPPLLISAMTLGR
jgi:predicted Zn-dependent protease